MSWDVWLETTVDGKPVSITDGTNYTHNCNPMIREAGFKDWPHVDGWRAGTVSLLLEAALQDMHADPDKYRAMNPPNGWGSYDGLVDALTEVYADCLRFPSATVRVWA